MANPCQLWDYNVIANVPMACIILHKIGLTFAKYVEGISEIENQQAHYNLKNDLIDHL
jgi:hypothetical protein